MDSTLYYLVTVAVAAVAVVLLLGLITLMRGRSANLSQTLMRWRVALQFAAIVLIAIFVYLFYRT